MMNKRLWWCPMAMIIVSFVVLAPAPAQEAKVSAFRNGNELYEGCTSNNQAKQAYCLGYVAGVIDLQRDAQSTDPALIAIKLCVPRGVTLKQVADVVVDYLRRNPKSRHNTAASLVELALMRAWPCK